MKTACDIAQSIVGPIDWQDSTRGYCKCPGQQFHTHRNGRRDCVVYLDKIPSVFCVHSSCSGEVERTNHTLRSAVAKSSLTGQRWRPTPEDIRRQTEKQNAERLARRAAASLKRILSAHACEPADLFEQSPVYLCNANPAEDWRLMLSLFAPDDVVWIGNPTDSGKPADVARFRAVAEWLSEAEAPGNYTTGSVFKPGSFSRANDNVVRRPYLVVESDVLGKHEICAVFAWMRQFMRLRAVVDTGGKSLHGWFRFPEPDQLSDLRVVLPKLGCDPALFKPSQPVRLPGARRDDKWQALLYLNMGGGR